MKKNITIMSAVVLIAAVAILGTVAYLQDSARNDNTMTMGKVDISQWEYQRKVGDDGKYETDNIENYTSYVLEGYQQDKMLLPVVTDPANSDWDETTVRMSQVGSHGGMQVLPVANVQDKFVIVENTGNSAAYVRTIVAIEVGTADSSLVMTNSRGTKKANEAGEKHPWFKNEVGIAEIDGTNYYIYEFVYEGAKTSNGYKHEDGVLPVGEKTYPSLCQVYLKPQTTNEDMIKLDGNSNKKLDILVLSQAVQADGWTAANDKTVAQTALDTAFGEVNATNVATWFTANP